MKLVGHDVPCQAIETLKKRGEKGAMILAISELGDVHAHFGNWSGAMGAWGDALDTLIGPYQVRRGGRGVAQCREVPVLFGIHHSRCMVCYFTLVIGSPCHQQRIDSHTHTHTQVVKNWRKALDGRSREQVLNQYGMHGCLLAGGILLGKLAR
jgi:hypothetical protein